MTQISSDPEREILVLQAPGPEVDAFLEWIRRTRSHVTILERTAEAVVLHTNALPNGVIPTIVSQRCTILWPATFSDGIERYTILAPSRHELSRLTDRLAALGEARIEWFTDVPLSGIDLTSTPLADVTSTFTRKQLEVLRRAVDEGYYDAPRRANRTDLAALMGIAPSTFDEHLRKAERRVMERFAGVLRANPQLAAGATVRPGRPRRANPKREAR